MKNCLRFLSQEFKETTPGCAIGVVYKGMLVLKKSYGCSNLQQKKRITSCTAFRLASLTKPFTAMAIMILQEQGLLEYDDFLYRYISDFPNYGKYITLRMLLTHTSGVADHEKPLYKNTKKTYEPTMHDALEELKKIKSPLFTPGSKFRYSNAGYVLLALVIEKISGQSYREFIINSIFKPLRMSTSVVLDEKKYPINNRAYGYKNGRLGYTLFDYDKLNFIVGDEGIYSSIEDLAKWSCAWNDESLVQNNSLKIALQRYRLANGKWEMCGFGWFINNKYMYHTGTWVGFTNIMLTDLQTKSTAILLSNTDIFKNIQKRIQLAIKLLTYAK